MSILHQLRWIIADRLISWATVIAPRDEGRDDLAVTLTPWLGRQVQRSEDDMRRRRAMR
jgi:hypothetical protein